MDDLDEMVEKVAEIEKGDVGVRITWKTGEREFMDGGVGFELYRRWLDAELLRLYPQLRIEVLPNGERIIRGIRLKTEEEKRSGVREGEG